MIGARMMQRLERIAQRDSGIGDIRTLGAMTAMELVKNGDADAPDAERTAVLVAEARSRGLILLSCGVRGNVIRFLAPLTIPLTHLDEGLDILDAALEATA